MEKGEHFRRENRPTLTQIHYLDALSRADRKNMAQRAIAREFGVNASTVNRFFKSCIARGILTDKLELTSRGAQWLEHYRKLYKELIRYLRDAGGSEEASEKAAGAMVENVDPDILDLIILSRKEKGSFRMGRGQNWDPGFLDNLEKIGRLHVIFHLYRMSGRMKGTRDSMAMGGFERNAELVAENGQINLELRLKTMTEHSRVNGEKMTGYLESLKYEINGTLRTANIAKGRVRIPLEAFRMHRWAGIGISAMSPVIVTCSVGQIHMPESTALLYFWA